MGAFSFFGGIFLLAFLTVVPAVINLDLDIPRNFKMVISMQEFFFENNQILKSHQSIYIITINLNKLSLLLNI